MKNFTKSLKSLTRKSIYALFGASVTGILLLNTPSYASYSITPDVKKHNHVLEYFLDELEQCESGGSHNAFVENDGGSGRNSRGKFQFQARTVKYYMQKYGMYNGEEDEDIINLLHGGDFSRNLAREIITREKEGWKNWYTCSKKIGLDNYK